MPRDQVDSTGAARVVRPRPHEDGLACVLLGDGTLAVTLPETGLPALMRELDARESLSHRHLRPVLSIDRGEEGQLRISVPRLREARLSAWLAQRGVLGPGEALTVLAPLAELVAAAHAAGVVFDGLAPAEVGFDDEWAPVLATARRMHRVEARSEAALDNCEAAARDIASLRQLIEVVASACDPAFGQELLGALESDGRIGGAAARLHRRLFELGTPEPLVANAEELEERASGRTDIPRPGAGAGIRTTLRSAPPPARPRRAARNPRGAGRTSGTDVRLGRRLAERSPWPSRPIKLPSRFRIAACARLPLLAISAAVASAGLALILVPGGVGRAGTPAGAPSAPATSATSPPTAVRSSGPSGASDPARAPTGAASASPRALARNDELLGVARALLDERERCLELADAQCLNRVDQAGSPLALADAHALAARLSWIRVPSATIQAAGDFGDGAVFVAAELPSMSVLIVKTGAGWRLRSLSRADG